mgnify:CR=1 FL=1
MSFNERNKLLLAKIESSYGVDPTPTEADNAILTKGITRRPYGGDQISRDLDRQRMGNDHQIVVGEQAEVTFDVELAGSGTAGTAPQFGELLRACGFGQTIVVDTSVTYAHVSSSFESCTFYFNYDGEMQKVTGCRGTVTMNLSRGQFPMLSFRFVGIYQKPTAVAMYDPTFRAITPSPVNDTNTTTHSVHSQSVVLSQFTYNPSIDLVYRNLPGYTGIDIVDRAPSGNVRFEAPALATKDFFAAVESHAGSVVEGAISVVHGPAAGDGNNIAISVPQSQLLPMDEAGEDKKRMFDIPYIALPTDAGNDEFSLAFT